MRFDLVYVCVYMPSTRHHKLSVFERGFSFVIISIGKHQAVFVEYDCEDGGDRNDNDITYRQYIPIITMHGT